MSFKMPGSQSHVLVLRQKFEEFLAGVALVLLLMGILSVPHIHAPVAALAGVEWRMQKAEAQLCVQLLFMGAQCQHTRVKWNSVKSLTLHLMFSLGITKHVTSLCSPKGLFGSLLASHCDMTEGGITTTKRCRERRQQSPKWSNSFIAQYL